ncbi:outer membrane protein [Croceicoccus bisphenolivorans]|uniref:outer membrane protein n=1 Tax=Croceicoccus bisphenolivorans TaxID=1783232 RepID=UPI0008318EFB|nr:outer membrane beta-barrel protein [Croceicoccus bisphenolivorans]
MRTIVIGLLAACSVASVAQAEALDGPFVGVAVSRDAYEVKAEGLDLGYTSVSADGISANGVSGSIYAGYDYLMAGNVFFGVEGNATLSNASMSLSYDDGDYSYGTKVEAQEGFGLSARLGYKVAGQTGIYARGGWQTTKFKLSESEDGDTLYSESDWQDAFVYGAGIETALGTSTSIRVEYVNEDYGSAGINGGLGVNGVRVDNGKVSLGLSYGF